MPPTLDPAYRDDLRHLQPLIAADDHAALVMIAARISRPTYTPEEDERRRALVAEYDELREVALEAATLTGDPNQD